MCTSRLRLQHLVCGFTYNHNILCLIISNIIKKANLSSDKQAVREMNEALAEYAAANGYTKPKDIEAVMHILANAGFNAETWRPLTSGYEIYWDKQENKMVLYNASTGELEYPDEYEGNEFTAQNQTDKRFEAYDGNVEIALSYDYSFNSSTISNAADKSLSSTAATNTAASTISSAVSTSSGSQIKSAIGLSDSGTVYVNASSTSYSSTYNSSNAASSTYASITAMHLSNQSDIELDNNGELKANTFVVATNIAENATAQQIAQAQKDAGSMLYSVMVQSNAGLLENSVSIIIPAGTVLDVSNNEWKASKTWQGYIGTTDKDHPCVIKGLRLTEATSYALTYQMQGSSSRYNITGFIGALYGKSTVENLVFQDVTIDSPGKDYLVVEGQKSRNTVAIIGGIIPDPGDRQKAINVTVRNIKVEDSCTINGIASVGGIIGYIGAEEPNTAAYNLKGTVLIEGCEFAGKVVSTDEVYAGKGGYSPAGGIVGFTCRCSATELDITVKDCHFKGTVSGQGSVGGIIGGIISGKKISVQNCSVEGATITGNGTKGNVAKIVGYTQSNLDIDNSTLNSVSAGDVYVYVYKKTNVNGSSVNADTELKK